MLNRVLCPTVFSILMLSASITTAEPYSLSVDSLKKHVSVLTSDSLEGRKAGSPGELKAAQYIESVFTQAGLQPHGDSGSYRQEFEFTKKVVPGSKTKLVINGQQLTLQDDFEPLDQSAKTPFSFTDIVYVKHGIIADDHSIDDYSGKDVKGKTILIQRVSKHEIQADANLNKYRAFRKTMQTAISHGVAGIIYLPSPDQTDDFHMMTPIPSLITHEQIPILYLTRKGVARLNLDTQNPVINDVQGEVDFTDVPDTAYNVIGYLKGKSDTTIVIGAHYDHLGVFKSENSKNKQITVFKGADDNASGTAGILELARYFSARQDQLHYSLLFAAFSGEEALLVGSKFLANKLVNSSNKVIMILDFDMIGRLGDHPDSVMLNGVASSPELSPLLKNLPVHNLILYENNHIPGLSDHNAFIDRGIPGLMLSSGITNDVHKPTDSMEKLDFPGEVRILNVGIELLSNIQNSGAKLTFQKKE